MLSGIPTQVKLLVIAFAVTLVAGLLIIPLLKKLKVGQNVRDDGPQSHLKKAGTPSMGGLIFLIPFTGMTLLLIYKFPFAASEIWGLVLVTLAFGAIGFIDDFLKIIKKRSVGLRAWQKMFFLIVVSAGFGYYLVHLLNIGTDTFLPIYNNYIDLGKYFIPFVILVLISTTNVVNITDGLDGLAGGIMTIIMAFFTVYGVMNQNTPLALLTAIMTGCCLGFLAYNINPARVFMGDTGSLALGGFMGAIALMFKIPILLIIIAGVCVLEELSYIIQVIYFRYSGGKRVFKMAPLHHHFELSGWSERKVVRVFWGATIVFCIVSFFIVK